MKTAYDIASEIWMDVYDSDSKNAIMRIESALINFAKQHRKKREQFIINELIRVLGIDHITLSQIKSLIANRKEPIIK